MIAVQGGTLLRFRHMIRRKATVDDGMGGQTTPSWNDLAEVDGSELAPQMAREAFFTHQLKVRKQAVIWVNDTVGITEADRVRDASGEEWEILGIAAHGPFKQLRLVEARN